MSFLYVQRSHKLRARLHPHLLGKISMFTKTKGPLKKLDNLLTHSNSKIMAYSPFSS